MPDTTNLIITDPDMEFIQLEKESAYEFRKRRHVDWNDNYILYPGFGGFFDHTTLLRVRFGDEGVEKQNCQGSQGRQENKKRRFAEPYSLHGGTSVKKFDWAATLIFNIRKGNIQVFI